MVSLQSLTDEEWLQAARASLKSDDLHLVSVRNATAIIDGDGEFNGFIGDILRVRVVVKRNGDTDEEEVGMFLKAAPKQNSARIALALGTNAFIKEKNLFVELQPLMRAAVGDSLVPWASRCLFSKGDQLLVLEDLSMQDFKTLGSREYLDFDHCAVALEAVARLHASSLVLEEQDRRERNITPWCLGERFPDTMQETMFTNTFENHFSKFICTSVPVIKEVVGLMPEYKNHPQFEEILKKIENILQISWDMVKPSKKVRNVVCHGDLWVNNMMFKYDTEGKVCEARLVDFQIVRYCPPALDVQCVLHVSCRRPLRREREAELRERYYSALSEALKTQKLSAEVLVPRKDFEESCDRNAAFGRIIAACYDPAHMLTPEILLPQVSSEELFNDFLIGDRTSCIREGFTKDEFYCHRLREIMAELIEGVILPELPKL